MLNIIWPIFILISIIYAIFSGNLEDLNSSIFNSTESAVSLTISLLGTICLWNGIIEIVNSTSIITKITKLLRPFMKLLFPQLKREDKEYTEISMNIISNMLGLGNAATPLGLKAMKSMQSKNSNKSKLTDSMAMFIIINTASIQIIPTTVIAIRNSLGSTNPTKIILPVWVATICAAIVGITVAKICIRSRRV